MRTRRESCLIVLSIMRSGCFLRMTEGSPWIDYLTQPWSNQEKAAPLTAMSVH